MAPKSSELAENLLAYLDMLPAFPGNLNIQRFKLEEGKALSKGIFSEEPFSIAFTEFSKNCVFTQHSHRQNEYFICIEGEGVLTVESRVYKMTRGVCVYALANMPHSFKTFDSPCSLLVITVPGSPDFPRGLHE